MPLEDVRARLGEPYPIVIEDHLHDRYHDFGSYFQSISIFQVTESHGIG
jgi:hypothetical protein